MISSATVRRVNARLAGRLDVPAAIFAGGCLGGLARYAATQAWPSGRFGFPWAILAVNLAGAFVLGFVVVLATEVLPPTRYVRAFVGTGFCGALTTLSSLVATADQKVAHGRAGSAVAYLALSVAAGLVAGVVGIAVARALGRGRAVRTVGEES